MSMRRYRILVADDDRDTADATAEMLRLFGDFETLAVYGGWQAVESARSFRPEAVVLDIDMPVMNGYEAAAALRRDQAPDACLVLVALTGRTRPGDAELSRRAGFDQHIGKPADASRLCASIHALIGRAVPGSAGAADRLRAASTA